MMSQASGTGDEVQAYMRDMAKQELFQEEMDPTMGSSMNSAGAANPDVFATPDASLPKPTNERALSMASKKYDRNNKGYLDETERALRRMDSQGLGYLQPDKVYTIMEALQREQKSNTLLINELRTESKRNLNLKKCIVLLVVFTIFLGLSNIATSFAAARLAKDTQVSWSNDLTNMDGVRLGTTAKQVGFTIQPVSPERRRRLEGKTALFCNANDPAATKNNGATTTADAEGTDLPLGTRHCTLQGEVTYKEAAKMYRQFCPGWKRPGDSCRLGSEGDAGVPAISLMCKDHQTTILGGDYLPVETPGHADDDAQHISFPAPHFGYVARASTFLYGHLLPCRQEFSLAFACDDEKPDSECGIFASWEEDERTCLGGVHLCGPPPRNDDNSKPQQTKDNNVDPANAVAGDTSAAGPTRVDLFAIGAGGGRQLRSNDNNIKRR